MAQPQTCDTCGTPVTGSKRVGVRASAGDPLQRRSAIWEFNQPCGHQVAQAAAVVRGALETGFAAYQGGPLWQAGYKWQSVYWGSYWTKPTDFTVAQVDKAVSDIEADPDYSGGLTEYNVGQGSALPSVVISDPEPPATIDDSAIGPQIASWIAQGVLPELGAQGAYNIFFPPGVTVTLQGQASCSVFCDYHSFDGTHAYTVEPYPCSGECNQCTGSAFDTLTQGLSEEMAELKTDMNPGTGWIIGHEEICDYCDANFVCKQISTGEYVNSWYSDKLSGCWSPVGQPPTPGPNPCLNDIEEGLALIQSGDVVGGLEQIVVGVECYLTGGTLEKGLEQDIKRAHEKVEDGAEGARRRLSSLKARLTAVASKV